MVIGIDASRANNEHRTGTEWYSYHVIQGLKTRIPAEHRVVLYSKEPLRGDLATLPPNWSSKVLNWPPKLLWTQFRLSWEMLFHKPDLLYISAHTTPIISPAKTVSVIHDVGFLRQTELYTTRELRYHRFALNLAVKKSTEIITVSQFSQSEIHDVTGVPKEHIHVIPNGLNIRRDVSDETVFATHAITKPYLLFVGRVEEKKNMFRLIEAYAELRAHHGFTGPLVLAGSPGFGHERITARMNELGIREHVIETGWISEEALGTLMQQARVFVFPSLYEGFGIPVLEAMSLGVPVACSDIPPLREIAANAATFFDPKNPQHMAQTIATLLPDSAHDSYAQQGREQAAKFSWERTADETWNVLQSVL